MQTPPTEMVQPTAGQVFLEIMDLYKEFKPTQAAYAQYAEKVIALSKEYHRLRIAEAFPEIPIEEGTIVRSFDIRQTPKSLDAALATLATEGLRPTRVLLDMVNCQLHLIA